jgi:putative hydrolase of the HAD superfamily
MRASRPAIRGLFFDVGGTLVRPCLEITDVIREEAARAGVRLPSSALGALPGVVAAGLADRARAGVPFSFPAGESKRFWTTIYAGALDGSCEPERAATITERVYGRLASPSAYCLFEDVLPTLQELRTRGLVLGVITNWEAWLVDLLAATGLATYFVHVVVSGVVGFEKPDRRIFELAVGMSGLRPEELLYVGDNPEVDVRAAEAAGLQAVLLRRDAHVTTVPGMRGDPRAIASLPEVADLLRM